MPGLVTQVGKAESSAVNWQTEAASLTSCILAALLSMKLVLSPGIHHSSSAASTSPVAILHSFPSPNKIIWYEMLIIACGSMRTTGRQNHIITEWVRLRGITLGRLIQPPHSGRAIPEHTEQGHVQMVLEDLQWGRLHNLSVPESVPVLSHLHSKEILPQYSGAISCESVSLHCLMSCCLAPLGRAWFHPLHEAFLQILTGIGEVSCQLSLLETEQAQLLSSFSFEAQLQNYKTPMFREGSQKKKEDE